MKKNLFILAAAAVALASCSSDDLISENAAAKGGQPVEIGVMPVAQTATRAKIIENGVFPTDLDMYVSAYDKTNTFDHISGAKFSHNWAGGASSGTNNYWGGNPNPYYWPLSPAYLNFLAYANFNGTDGNPVTGATWNATHAAAGVELAMSDNYPTATAQKDLLYAIGNAEVKQAGNALIIPDKVDMVFKHALSNIVFRVKANSTVEAAGGTGAITVKNVTIKGAYFSGTATINHTGYNAETGQAATLNWTNLGYHTSADADNSVTESQAAITQTLSKDDYTQVGEVVVVPKMSAVDTYEEGAFTSFTITYALNGKDYTYTYTPTTTKLEANKKYIYDITFKLHEIFVDPTVDEWDATPTNYVDIPSQAFEYTEGGSADFNIPAVAGKYTFTISKLPAETYTVVEGTTGEDFIPDGGITTSSLTVAADGSINVTVNVTASAGNQRPIELKLGGTTKFTVNVKQAAGN